jgi:hypothetical protein
MNLWSLFWSSKPKLLSECQHMRTIWRPEDALGDAFCVDCQEQVPWTVGYNNLQKRVAALEAKWTNLNATT